MNYTVKEWATIALMIGIISYGFGLGWLGWWILNIVALALLTFRWSR